MFPTQVHIGGSSYSLEGVKKALDRRTLTEVIEVLPENTHFFRVCIVSFKSVRSNEDIFINLEGRLEKRRIRWSMRSVFSTAGELLTEEELKRFSC